MVTTAGSLFGQMAPAPAPGPLEVSRQKEIQHALNNLEKEAAAINKALAAVQQNAQFSQKEAEIQQEPGKFSQPVGQIAALNARRDEIANLTLQLEDELSVPGAKGGLNRYDATRGPQYSPRQNLENISFRSAAAPQTVAQQAYAAVAKAGLNPNTYAGVIAQEAYSQVAEETLDPEAAAAAAAAVAAQVAQGQDMDRAAAVSVGRTVAEANYSNSYAADMEALGAPKGYAADMTALQGVMAQGMLGSAPATTAAQSLAQEALGLTQQAQPTPNELSAQGAAAHMGAVEQQVAEQARNNELAQQAFETVAPNIDEDIANLDQEIAAQQARNQFSLNMALGAIGLNPDVNPGLTAAQNRGMEISQGLHQNQPGLTSVPVGFVSLDDEGMTGLGLGPSGLGNTPSRTGNFTAPGLIGFTQTSGLTVGAMPAGVPGFSPSNAPQISAVTPVAPAESFFSAPEPVAPDATFAGPGTTVSGVQSSVPGISISPTGMLGAYAGYDDTMNSTAGSFSGRSQAAQVERGNVLGSLSLAPDPPSQNPRSVSPEPPSRNPERAAINAMMALEAELGQQQANQAKAQRAGILSGLELEAPAPTTSRSSSSRGRSSGRSSSGRSSRGAARSTATRSVATWGPEGQVTFSEEAADPSDTGPGCYIATDAVSSGAFSKLDKAKAELWCKRALHNHWAGETVRLGYQALSKRAVANGTASKHYDEFQRFVRYGRGLDKTLKGAVTFYTRMAQFFAVGVINRLKAR